MAKVLVVEDEPTIRKGINIWLTRSGYTIEEAEDGQMAMQMIDKNEYNLIILDVMLPYYDGYEVLNYIRTKYTNWVPVIMLTAKNDEDDRILGLNLGADDYMAKPFSNRELEARIGANLRKFVQDIDEMEIETKFFSINQKKYLLVNGNDSVELTRKEMDLLKLLIKNKGSFVKKATMLEKVWGYLDSDDTRTLDIHISKLRKKLEKIGVVNVIETKRGIGYGYIE